MPPKRPPRVYPALQGSALDGIYRHLKGLNPYVNLTKQRFSPRIQRHELVDIPTFFAAPVCQIWWLLSGILLTKLRHGGQQPVGITSLQHLSQLLLKLSRSQWLHINLAFAIQWSIVVYRSQSSKSINITKITLLFYRIQYISFSLTSIIFIKGRCHNQREKWIETQASGWIRRFMKAWKSPKNRMCSPCTPWTHGIPPLHLLRMSLN